MQGNKYGTISFSEKNKQSQNDKVFYTRLSGEKQREGQTPDYSYLILEKVKMEES
jgi:hypothetical protein